MESSVKESESGGEREREQGKKQIIYLRARAQLCMKYGGRIMSLILYIVTAMQQALQCLNVGSSNTMSQRACARTHKEQRQPSVRVCVCEGRKRLLNSGW